MKNSTRTAALSLLAPLLLGAVSSAQDTPETLFSSTLWRKDSNAIQGGYRIVQTGDKRVLHLGPRFSTKEGPDLKVVLSPLAVGDVKAKTALKDSLVLGPLKSHKGGSEYALPADVDLAGYASVLVHCEKYTKLWGAAPLAAGEVVKSGSSWTKKAEKINGGFEIARVGDALVVRLGHDFKTDKGPDLKVVLSPHTPKAASGDNALSGGLKLGLLRSNKGYSEYRAPAGADLSSYRSLLIHCEQYSKLWGGAAL
jgi:hypothetical protein